MVMGFFEGNRDISLNEELKKGGSARAICLDRPLLAYGLQGKLKTTAVPHMSAYKADYSASFSLRISTAIS